MTYRVVVHTVKLVILNEMADSSRKKSCVTHHIVKTETK